MTLNKDKKTFFARHRGIIYTMIPLVLLPSIAIFLFKHDNIKQYIISAINYIKNETSYASYLVFIIAIQSLFFNATIPNLLSGYIFGLYKGTILTTFGCLLSAVISFISSRYYFKKEVNHFIKDNEIIGKYYKVIKKTEDIMKNEDWFEIIGLSRLAPISPYQLFSLFWGITEVPLWIYILGTLWVIPSVIFETYMGTQIKDLDNILNNNTKLTHLIAVVVISVIIGFVADHIINSRISDFNKRKQEETRENVRT